MALELHRLKAIELQYSEELPNRTALVEVSSHQLGWPYRSIFQVHCFGEEVYPNGSLGWGNRVCVSACMLTVLSSKYTVFEKKSIPIVG